MPTTTQTDAIQQHYGRADLGAAILARLAVRGQDRSGLSHLDLASLDQLHTRGRLATLELAQLAEVRPGWQVLDVGGGLGGPARIVQAVV
jgi:hypothetical protein